MNKENLANGLLASPVSTGATSATLQTGYGATMPAVPFKLTVTPFGQLSTKGNSEIWLVTARSGEVLTITRAQEGTTAKGFIAGDIVSNGVYVGDVIDTTNIKQDATNSKLVRPLLQSGYGVVKSGAGASSQIKGVLFPVAYKSGTIPTVTATAAGYKPAGTTPVNPTTGTDWAKFSVAATATTNLGFTAYVVRFDGAGMSDDYYFMWQSIGEAA